MKKTFLPVLLWLCASALRAQFYAPETEYHDRSQRVFPVEAARVLAWRQNFAGVQTAEVKYKLETSDLHEVVWQIQWLDGRRKVIREKEVRYPESLLAEGPKYFREVFRQIAGDDWRPAAGPVEDSDAAFWKGANEAGVSRLEALTVADGLARQAPGKEKAADAARLAGVLAHGTMPLIATSMTLDSRMLSRAAAWLCLAEALGGKAGDAAWAPILFLSGREAPAETLWKSAATPGAAQQGGAGRFWDLMAGKASTKECFLFATRKENLQFAAPAMIYPAQFDQTWMSLFVSVSDDAVGVQNVPRLFEYAPNVTGREGAPNALWAASMPELAMLRWLELLSGFKPQAGEYTGYQSAMTDAVKAASAVTGDEKLTILALAPLLNQGIDQGNGALNPVAVVTTRDLLGYGWEMAGLQFGYRYHALKSGLKDTESAERLGRAVLDEVKGVEVFFDRRALNTRAPLRDYRRLQFIGSTRVDNELLERPPTEWTTSPDRLCSRIWLKRGGQKAVEAMIRQKAGMDLLRKTIDRMRNEGGPLAVGNLINRDANHKFPAVIDLLGLRDTLTADLPWAYLSPVAELSKEVTRANAFERAQGMEKICWANLTFRSPHVIFRDYLVGNAEASAKRFYDEVLPFTTDRETLSNSTAPARYAIAWIDGDEKMEKKAIQDCDPSSLSSARLEIMDAILHGDSVRATRLLELCVLHFQNEGDTSLRTWLPLAPALLDARHPDHDHAIEAFPDDEAWIFLGWALARQARLPEKEGARLFGEKNAGIQRVFIAMARGDKTGLGEVFATINVPAIVRAVMAHEYYRLAGTRPPEKQADLKPPGARPLEQLIREEIKQQELLQRRSVTAKGK